VNAEEVAAYQYAEAHASALPCPHGWGYNGVEVEVWAHRSNGVLKVRVGAYAYYTTGACGVRRSVGICESHAPGSVDVAAVLVRLGTKLQDPDVDVPWRRKKARPAANSGDTLTLPEVPRG
jgi:hypothetical protein